MVGSTLEIATDVIKNGGIVAYPTEGVYGLGCDPFNKTAVDKTLALKQREVAKGLIIIAANWEQLQVLTQPIPPLRLEQVLQTSKEKPITWVFPASEQVPEWITGKFTSIAIRVTQHPVAKALCELAGPLVSTSANISSRVSAKTAAEVTTIFGAKIDFVINAPVGNLAKSTSILNALDGAVLRN